MARVFISHKHSDRAIATVIRGFVTEQTANRVKVFQSSDSGEAAETPMVGRPLNPQKNGKADEPILGWITDVIVAESES